jgi:hypothetical protein
MVLCSLQLLMIKPTLAEGFFDELKGEERFASTHSEALNQLKRAVRQEALPLREATSELVHNLGARLGFIAKN